MDLCHLKKLLFEPHPSRHQTLRHSVLLFRSEVLAKVFISLDHYSEAAKYVCTTIWKSMDPCWLQSLVEGWKQPSFVIIHFQVHIETLRGNIWLFPQAHATSKWFCNESHSHCTSERYHRLQ